MYRVESNGHGPKRKDMMTQFLQTRKRAVKVKEYPEFDPFGVDLVTFYRNKLDYFASFSSSIACLPFFLQSSAPLRQTPEPTDEPLFVYP
jgi:hypothetical protein